jgi:hypothetical protein
LTTLEPEQAAIGTTIEAAAVTGDWNSGPLHVG